MDPILSAIISYLTGLAVNMRTSAVVTSRENALKQQVAISEERLEAKLAVRSLKEEVRSTCIKLARNLHVEGVSPEEKAIWKLLANERFQDDIAGWIVTGGIEEGDDVKDRLLRAMEEALSDSAIAPEQKEFLKSGYFELIEKTIFSHPILANWRHQLCLDYLREQVAELRVRAEEAAGKYSKEKIKAVLDSYYNKALESWDIIDLSNLPEGDIHMATQQLLLRQLYMPLRISVEGGEEALVELEAKRDLHRRQEAGHSSETENEIKQPLASVGERLALAKKLVVLGDPGGGKTTMLRWMATAFLLKLKGDAAFAEIPDATTLPDQKLIPVLIRCRDLGKDDLCRCFKDFLTQHLHKTKLLPEEADVMVAVILDGLAKGEVLLLIDGLDEITDSQVRMMFCQELEHTTARYPDSPIVVTSRIVGYRDMPYRMSSGFEHGVIAELKKEDKDLFAHRWVDVTEQNQPPEEKSKRVEELLEALHSSNRIERLTGNPMLLTTLALVKRKVGKLPNKRTKLYAEAVSVLLNWNPRLYETIEEDEAIPQLEYLAYEMCKHGIQRLTEDEVIELLEKLRAEYPNIRAVRRRDAESFLAALEARSSILIKSGGVWKKSDRNEEPVWEFRHLTFQEYLAAKAILDGRYSDRKRSLSLAEQVAPLAGDIKAEEDSAHNEVNVSESWREALRLLVADCKDDDVDDVLRAIADPMEHEDSNHTARPRAVLAALCLTDEPNVSEQAAEYVIDTFINVIKANDGEMYQTTMVDAAAYELSGSMWSSKLNYALAIRFLSCLPEERFYIGALLATLEGRRREFLLLSSAEYTREAVEALGSDSLDVIVIATLGVMQAAFQGSLDKRNEVGELLYGLLDKGDAVRFAATWALVWVTGAWGAGRDIIKPKKHHTDKLVAILKETPAQEIGLRRQIISICALAPSDINFAAIMSQASDKGEAMELAVVAALRKVGGARSVLPLVQKTESDSASVRKAAIGALAKIGGRSATEALIRNVSNDRSTVRVAAIEALVELADLEAVPAIIEAVKDQDADARMAAITALGQLQDKRASLPLIDLLEEELQYEGQISQGTIERYKKPAIAIARALGFIGDNRAITVLKKSLASSFAPLHISSAIALANLGDPEGFDASQILLKSNVRGRRDATVREIANTCNDSILRRVISKDLDGAAPWLHPQETITKQKAIEFSEVLKVSIDKIEAVLVRLKKFGFSIEQ
uniref:Putative signal transduction protein with Nacht domain n=1 Tax=Ectopseudomonas mendocina (strain ymp) TaxID=399739 RepID=A4XR49_ECTM1